jgi:hypothetical protein
LLTGKITSASPEEGIEWADVCVLKRLHRTAARFYAAAFAARPELMDDPNSDLLDCAARAAARAGCGEGEDAAKLDDKEKERLRGQALGWLQRVLAVRTRQPAGGKPADRAAAQAAMRRWQTDAALAGVRGPDALARLPRAERQRWRKWWDDVADALAEIETGTTDKK